MNRFKKVAWTETEKEHRAYVAESAKRRNQKLDDTFRSNGKHLQQWTRQDSKTPITTMKKTDGKITTNFQEIHQIFTEAWKPICSRWEEDREPQFNKFKEPLQVKKLTSG